MKNLFTRLKNAARNLLGRPVATPTLAPVLEKEPSLVVNARSVSAEEAEQSIAQLIASYKDEVCWDEETGTVSINGKPSIPYTKDYWFVSTDEPFVEIIDTPEVAAENAVPTEPAPEVPTDTKPKRTRRSKAKPEAPAAETPAPAKKPRKKKE